MIKLQIKTKNTDSLDFVFKPVKKTTIKNDFFEVNNYDWINAPDPYYEECELYENNNFIGDCKVKVRGNYSTVFRKKSLKIKFLESKNIAGLHDGNKYKKWNLIAAYKDVSFLRDYLGLKLYSKLFPERYVSDVCLIDLTINNKRFGTYILEEEQSIKRITKDLNHKNFLLEYSAYKPNDKYYFYIEDKNKTILDIDNKKIIYNKNYIVKNKLNDEDKKFISEYMRNIWDKIYNLIYHHKYYENDKLIIDGNISDEMMENYIRSLIDLDSLIDIYIFNEIIVNPDIYISNFFMWLNYDRGYPILTFGAPFDLDSSMGFNNFCVAEKSNNKIIGKKESFVNRCMTNQNRYGEKLYSNPWLTIFCHESWFKKLLKERWNKFNLDEVKNFINIELNKFLTSDYQESFEFTRKKFGIYGDLEICSYAHLSAKKSQIDAMNYLKNWLIERIDNVDNLMKNLI